LKLRRTVSALSERASLATGHCQQPRSACRQSALDDHEGSMPPSVETPYGGGFAALDRSVTDVECPELHPLQGEGL